MTLDIGADIRLYGLETACIGARKVDCLEQEIDE
jgi:hypothetical protein